MVALSRRGFLSLASGACLAGDTDEARLRVFRDAATEAEVVRYTDPAFRSSLLPAHRRSITRRSRMLIYCSEQAGPGRVISRLDLRSGESSPVATVGPDVLPEHIELLPDERSIVVLESGTLRLLPVGGGRPTPLYAPQPGWTISDYQPEPDGSGVTVLERSREGSAIRRVGNRRRSTEAVAAGAGLWTALRVRPGPRGALYRAGNGFWYAERGSRPEPVELEGKVGQTVWSRDGRSLLYLSTGETGAVQLREHIPETAQDRLIANTTRFAAFAPNSDASVFAGLSGSVAAPYVLVLVRVSRRELTLCEHRTSAPSSAVVLFTPDSQRVLFQTDRQGKPAIFGVSTEKLVEETDQG